MTTAFMTECEHRLEVQGTYYCDLKYAEDDYRCFNLTYSHLCRVEEAYRQRIQDYFAKRDAISGKGGG